MAHGVMYLLLAQTQPETTLATLVVAYLTLVSAAIPATRIAGRSVRRARRHWPIVLSAGVLGAAGTGPFVVVATTGSVGTAAVIAETSPALTALLVRVTIKEPMPPARALGIASAVIAIVLFSI